jgi:outer membrane receptor protein involved in Fe transport
MLAIRVGGYSQYMGGYIDDLGLGGKDANRGHDEGFRASLLYQPLDKLRIRLNASIQKSFVNGYNTVDYNDATLQPLYGDLEQKRYTPETFRMGTRMYSAEVQWDTALGSLISATSYSAFEPQNGADLTFFYAGLLPYISVSMPAGGLSNHDDSQTTQELRFTSNRLGIVEFIAGGFYQHENLHDLQHYYTYNTTGQIDTSVAPLALSYHTGTLTEYAGFADATIYIAPRLDVTLGTRHSQTDQTRQQYTTGILYEPDQPPGYVYANNQKFTETANTCLGGIRWRVTDDVMIYGRAASGYRPGGGRSVPPGFPAGFSDVYTSDSIWSYEAGVKIRALDGRLTVDADTFWINWSNIQTLITVGGFNTDGNAGTARSRGAELQVAYIPIDGMTVGANAAYTDAKFAEDNTTVGVTKGERLFFVPNFTGTAYVNYSWSGAWKPSVGAEYDYRSSQLDITRVTLPGYSLSSAHAGIQHENQTVVMYIKNLANVRGLIGSQGDWIPGTPFPVVITQPRTLGITFSQKF